jgi:UDP-glucose 4-epimerase
LDIIVGNRGFIGNELTTHLKELQIDCFTIPSREALQNFVTNPRDIDILNISNVVWLAGKSLPMNTSSRHDLNYRNDFESLELFINVLRRHDWQGRIIFLSSGGCIYRESPYSLTENSSLQPNNAYGQLKLDQEKLIQVSSVAYSILRVSNVFGFRNKVTPGQDVISNWIDCYSKGEQCKVFGSLKSFRDFINVLDVVKAIRLASQSIQCNYIVNIGSGEKISTEQLVEIFLNCTHGKIRFDFQHAREFDRNGYVLDVSKAKYILNWNPDHSKQIDVLNFIAEQISL